MEIWECNNAEMELCPDWATTAAAPVTVELTHRPKTHAQMLAARKRREQIGANPSIPQVNFEDAEYYGPGDVARCNQEPSN
eukprot:gene14808-biopygen11349